MYNPYFPPGWQPVPPSETKKGLSHIVKAMYLSLIVMAVALVMLAVVFASLSDFDTVQTDEDFGELAGVLVVAGVLALVLLIVGLATVIYALMGLVEMNRGRHEFGPVHAKRVQRAIIFIVVAIAIAVIGAVASTAVSLNEDIWLGDGTLDWEAYHASLILSSIVGAAFSIVGAVFQNLIMVYLVVELVDQKHKGYLWTGFWVGMATAVAGAVLRVALVAYQTEDAITGLTDTGAMTIIPIGLSLISFIIFLVCYKHALGRLESGELKAIMPQMPMYPPPGYYAPPPGYYAPPPGYYPTQPPPYQQTPPPYPQPPPMPQQAQAQQQPPVQPQPVGGQQPTQQHAPVQPQPVGGQPIHPQPVAPPPQASHGSQKEASAGPSEKRPDKPSPPAE